MFKRYLLVGVLALCLIPMSFAQKDKMEKTGGYARILGMGNNPYIAYPQSNLIPIVSSFTSPS